MYEQIQILRDPAILEADLLASHVQANGYVVFGGEPTQRRALAYSVADIMDLEGVEVVRAETREGVTTAANGLMCIVNMDRVSLAAVLEAATEVHRLELMGQNGPSSAQAPIVPFRGR